VERYYDSMSGYLCAPGDPEVSGWNPHTRTNGLATYRVDGNLRIPGSCFLIFIKCCERDYDLHLQSIKAKTPSPLLASGNPGAFCR
jgi:hypothetical protein